MKQVLIAMAISIFACTSAEAQTNCQTLAPKSKTAVKHTSTTTKTTSRITACRMLPYQVCTILPDRRSVSCYTTTDSAEQTQTGPATIYGPTGAMPGKVVKMKMRTIVINGPNKGSYCKRNKENNATECYQPGYLMRDENGYYSYGEPVTKAPTRAIAIK